jgi:radical SAM-linked protein
MADIVQRWRLVYRRGSGAAGLAQRAELEAWESALVATDLPLATSNAAHPRPRLSMPPPLPVGFTGTRELLDLHLLERWQAADVRRRLEPVLPADHGLAELFDVWVGSPPLPADVVALDYAVATAPTAPGERLAKAVDALLGASRLERVRRRGERETRYDLRPFLLGLEVAGPPDRCSIRMRLAVHPEQGTGRPDEVVAALGERLEQGLAIAAGARTRIWTSDEPRPDAIAGDVTSG